MNAQAQRVDVSEAIKRQDASKEAIRLFPRASRKPRKAIKLADMDAAVNAALDEIDRELRRLAVEFPKFRQAYETARVYVQNARRKS